jgi:hypothetical protein
MDSRKKYPIFLGIILLFGIFISGCSNVETYQFKHPITTSDGSNTWLEFNEFRLELKDEGHYSIYDQTTNQLVDWGNYSYIGDRLSFSPGSHFFNYGRFIEKDSILRL